MNRIQFVDDPEIMFFCKLCSEEIAAVIGKLFRSMGIDSEDAFGVVFSDKGEKLICWITPSLFSADLFLSVSDSRNIDLQRNIIGHTGFNQRA